MKRLGLILWLLAVPAFAQQAPDPQPAAPQPTVEFDLDQTQIIPGQSATLRVTVLVPTWMPKPVEFPSFEAPNLRVRIPEKGTTSVSRIVDGATWAGVTRRYLLSPMVPGVITLPAQEIGITYAGPDTAPISVTVPTSEVSIAGVVPEGAEGLDPFIAASELTLTQELSGPTTGLEAGGSVIRTITAKMDGASPIILPKLTPSVNLPGIRVYEDSPKVAEEDDRGQLSGSRVESETLMAIGGGTGKVPPISVKWFDLDSKTIETATVDGFDVQVNGSPAKEDKPTKPLDWRVIAGMILAVLLVLVLLRTSLPRLMHWHRARRARHLASESHARHQLIQAVARKDYGATLQALAAWREKATDLTPRDQSAISQILLRIGAPSFSDSGSGDDGSAWRDLDHAIRAAGQKRQGAQADGLPPLNGLASR